MESLADRWIPVILQMSEADDKFRFAALIGSYARKDTPADRWSDLDLVTAFDDPDRMFSDTSWLNAFGEPKIFFAQELPPFGGRECRVLFTDGAMLDMVIYATKDYPEALYDDVSLRISRRGYRLLVDKDDLANSPRFKPDRQLPEESREDMIRRFQFEINCFWFHVVWTQKKLYRGEIMQAKECADRYLKDLLFDILRMKAKLNGGSASDTWHEARFFERWVDEEDLRMLRMAFARYDAQDIGDALERTMDLFAKVANEVADLLDISYPEETESCARETAGRPRYPAGKTRRDIVRPMPIRGAGYTKSKPEEDDTLPYTIIRSMYLCVRDMKRAVGFYEHFLEAGPVERDDIYSVFDVGGFRLGLFAHEKMGEPHTFGDNCLPSIEVASEEIFLEKLQGVEVVYGPKPIGNFLVAEFLDSEGNRIELTTRKDSAG